MTTWRLMDLIREDVPQTCISGHWVPARPVNWKVRTLRERLREAWRAFTGKYDTIIWPEDEVSGREVVTNESSRVPDYDRSLAEQELDALREIVAGDDDHSRAIGELQQRLIAMEAEIASLREDNRRLQGSDIRETQMEMKFVEANRKLKTALAEIERMKPLVQCCERDHNYDGDCDVHRNGWRGIVADQKAITEGAVRAAMDSANKLTAAEAEKGKWYEKWNVLDLDQHSLRQRLVAADKLAYEVAIAVMNGKFDERSAISDALLMYLNIGGIEGPKTVPEWITKYTQQLGKIMGHTGTGPHGSSNDSGEIFTPYPVTQDENNRVIAETLQLQEKIAILETKIKHLQARLRQYEPDPDICEHGVIEGDWCEQCNAEYKRAASVDGDIEIL